MSQKQEILLKLDDKTVKKFADLKKNVQGLDKAINSKFGDTLEKLSNRIDKLTQSLSRVGNINTSLTGRTVRQTTNLAKAPTRRVATPFTPSSNIQQFINSVSGRGTSRAILRDVLAYQFGRGTASSYESILQKTAQRGIPQTTTNILQRAAFAPRGFRRTTRLMLDTTPKGQQLPFAQYNNLKTGASLARKHLWRGVLTGNLPSTQTVSNVLDASGKPLVKTEQHKLSRWQRVRGAVNLAGYYTGLRHIPQGIANVSRRIYNAVGPWGLAAGVGSLAYGAARFGRRAYLEHAEYEQAQRQLNTLYRNEGAEVGGQVYEAVKGIARNTPLTFRNTVRASAKLAAYGVKGRTTGSTILQLGDLARGRPQALETAATVFGRVSRLGYLQGMERNMLVDATGFDPLSTYAKLKGKSVADVFKMMGDREFTIDKFKEALDHATGPLGRFGGMLDEMAKTGKGSLQKLESEFSLFMANVGNKLAPIATALVSAANWIMKITGRDDKGMLPLSQVSFKKNEYTDPVTGEKFSVLHKHPFLQMGPEGFAKFLEDKDVRRIISKRPDLAKKFLRLNELLGGEHIVEKYFNTDGYKFDPHVAASKVAFKHVADKVQEPYFKYKLDARPKELIDEITNIRLKMYDIGYDPKRGVNHPDYKKLEAKLNKLKLTKAYNTPSEESRLIADITKGVKDVQVPKTPEEVKKVITPEESKDEAIRSGGTRVKEININIEELFGIKAEKWDKNLEDSSEDIKSQVTTIFNEVLKNVETMA